jgi:hypothetical protein
MSDCECSSFRQPLLAEGRSPSCQRPCGGCAGLTFHSRGGLATVIVSMARFPTPRRPYSRTHIEACSSLIFRTSLISRPSHRLSRRGLQQVPVGAQRPAQTPSYSAPKQASRSHPAGLADRRSVNPDRARGQPPRRDRHPVLAEPSVRCLRMNPIHPGPLGQFHTFMQTHVRSRRLTTLRTVANPLPWRKLRWFDQRYEFGHWGGHIESARTGRHGARSRRRPIRRRLASPRGARGMTPTSTS